MFYLYATITGSQSLASFDTLAEAQATGARWFTGGGIIRTASNWPEFDDYWEELAERCASPSLGA